MTYFDKLDAINFATVTYAYFMREASNGKNKRGTLAVFKQPRNYDKDPLYKG